MPRGSPGRSHGSLGIIGPCFIDIPRCRALVHSSQSHAVVSSHWVPMWLYIWHLKHCFTRHCHSYRSHGKFSLCQTRPSPIILFASSDLVNSIVMVEADFADASLVSHPTCLSLPGV